MKQSKPIYRTLLGNKKTNAYILMPIWGQRIKYCNSKMEYGIKRLMNYDFTKCAVTKKG